MLFWTNKGSIPLMNIFVSLYGEEVSLPSNAEWNVPGSIPGAGLWQ